MGAGNEGNIKFISPDGHSEAIFYGDGTLVTDPSVYGTYNVIELGNILENTGHAVFDIAPFFILGNTPVDMFNGDRFGVAWNLGIDYLTDLFNPDEDSNSDPSGPNNAALGGDPVGFGPNMCY